MYELHDTFNKLIISRHRTVGNARKAARRHLASLKRANGTNCYLTYQVRRADGEPLSATELYHDVYAG